MRKGFIVDNGRVKFTTKEASGVAEYDELWYSWADGAVYTDATGSTKAYDDIFTMSIQDHNDNGMQDYKLVQPTDSPAELEAARELMLDVCESCHAHNFADERLLVADLIHENTKKVQMEALDIITALAAATVAYDWLCVMAQRRQQGVGHPSRPCCCHAPDSATNTASCSATWSG